MKVIRLYLTLISCFGATLGAIRWAGAAQTSALTMLFTNPDGSACHMPCLFGIRPGETTMGRALDMVHVHPLTRNMRQQVLEGQVLNGYIRLRAQGIALEITPEVVSNTGIVHVSNVILWNADDSDLTFRAPRPDKLLLAALNTATTGGLFLYFGAPSRILFGFGGTATFPMTVSMTYPDQDVTAMTRLQNDPYLGRSKVAENGRFLTFAVYSGGHLNGEDRSFPWFGFISTDTYTYRLCRMQPASVVCDGD
jgi:hypothetical protein